MTGEHHHHDELDFDDDETFILGEQPDELDTEFAEIDEEAMGAPSAASRASAAADPDADGVDDLFVLEDGDDDGVDVGDTSELDEVDAAFAAAAELAESDGEGEPVDDGGMFLGVGAEAEDVLFAPTTPEGSERFGSDAPAFDDAGAEERVWAGADFEPEEMGINTVAAKPASSLAGHSADFDELSGFGDDEELEIIGQPADEFGFDELGEFALSDGDPEAEFGGEADDAGWQAAEPDEAHSFAVSGLADEARFREQWAGNAADPSWAEDGDEFAGDALADDELAAAEAVGGWTADVEEWSGEEQWDDAESFAADGDWAPAGAEDEHAEADEFDPIYGAAEAEAVQAAAYDDAEPDYAEYQEAYVEADGSSVPVVIGGGPRRRRRLVPALLAAAMVVVGIGGGVAWMRPEWLGLQGSSGLIDRVVVARPALDLTVPTPRIADAAEVPPTQPVDPVAVDPTPQPPVIEPPVIEPPVVEPPVVEPPVIQQPVVEPPVTPPVVEPLVAQQPVIQPPSTEPPVVRDPQAPATDPTPTTPPLVAVSPDPTAPAPVEPGGLEDVVRIGDDLTIGRAAPTVRPRMHHLAEGLVSGSQAFAQLKNMNVFVGRVKAMDSSFLTLDLEPGEITLAFDNLNALIPLASDEYREMQSSELGFVRLRNSNKLFGKVLNQSLQDNILLEIQSNQVLIPRETIEEISQQTESAVRVLDEEGGEWMRRVLDDRARPPEAPPEPPAGGR